MASAVDRLQAWFLAQCDGRWERDDRIRVASLDQPGWAVDIDLTGTRWAGRDFAPAHADRAEHDWYRCWIEENHFRATCGPCSLDETLGRFLDWAAVPDSPAPTGKAVDDIYSAQCDWS